MSRFFVLFFFLIIPLPPRSTLFPYTTLFRSVEQVGAEHVARHQVGGELDTAELQVQTSPECARDHGLGGAGHALEQDVTADQEAREHQVDDRILADNGLADFAAHTLSDRADVLYVHRAFPLANGESRGRAAPALPGPAAGCA